MKYLMLISLLLVGCTVEQELGYIGYRKKACVSFKQSFDKVGVKNPSQRMKAYIESCKEVGAWE